MGGWCRQKSAAPASGSVTSGSRIDLCANGAAYHPPLVRDTQLSMPSPAAGGLPSGDSIHAAAAASHGADAPLVISDEFLRFPASVLRGIYLSLHKFFTETLILTWMHCVSSFPCYFWRISKISSRGLKENSFVCITSPPKLHLLAWMRYVSSCLYYITNFSDFHEYSERKISLHKFDTETPFMYLKALCFLLLSFLRFSEISPSALKGNNCVHKIGTDISFTYLNTLHFFPSLSQIHSYTTSLQCAMSKFPLLSWIN